MTNENPGTQERLSPSEFTSQLLAVYDLMPPVGTETLTKRLLPHMTSDDARNVTSETNRILNATPLTDYCKDWIRYHIGFDYILGPSHTLRGTLIAGSHLIANYGIQEQDFYREFERDCYKNELKEAIETSSMLADSDEEDRRAFTETSYGTQHRQAARDNFIERYVEFFAFPATIAKWRESFVEKYQDEP